MRCLSAALLGAAGALAALVPSNTAALGQQSQATAEAARGKSSDQQSSARLDRMIAAGKSQRELAQYLFDTHGCKDCHTLGREGKLGLTKKGEQRAEGFEGCISTLKAMSIIAKIPENQRSPTQLRRAERFEEFGCATCHKLTPAKMGLTETGAKLAHLHLGCADVERLLASNPGSN